MIIQDDACIGFSGIIVLLGIYRAPNFNVFILINIRACYGTRIVRRDMKGTSQIAEYATPSIWGNPTVTCVGSNAGV